MYIGAIFGSGKKLVWK